MFVEPIVNVKVRVTLSKLYQIIKAHLTDVNRKVSDVFILLTVHPIEPSLMSLENNEMTKAYRGYTSRLPSYVLSI